MVALSVLLHIPLPTSSPTPLIWNTSAWISRRLVQRKPDNFSLELEEHQFKKTYCRLVRALGKHFVKIDQASKTGVCFNGLGHEHHLFVSNYLLNYSCYFCLTLLGLQPFSYTMLPKILSMEQVRVSQNGALKLVQAIYVWLLSISIRIEFPVVDFKKQIIWIKIK